MRCVLSLPCLLAATAYVLTPSSSSRDGQVAFYGQPDSLAPKSDVEWNVPPNPNSTHHLIFNSVSGLIHRWPNTLRRNGATCFRTSTSISCKTAFQVIASFLRQYLLEPSYITGVPTHKFHIHPIGLRLTLNTPTFFAVNLATLSRSKQSATSVS